MRDEYDFSKATRGKFYRGDRPFKVTINVSQQSEKSQYEVFTDSDGKYRFRLTTAGTVLFTSPTEYDSKDDCISAIAVIRHASMLATTVSA